MGTISNELEQSKKYRLDIIEGIKYKRREISIAKLTTDNVARVEAMIFTDSGYKNSANDSKEIKYKKDSSEVKYVGSTAFWFNQLKELIDKGILVSSKGYDYNCIIEYLVIAIDNENSTHLNSDGIGRKEVTERLTDIKLKDLIQLLKNDNGNYDLIKLIEKPKKANEKHHF